MSESRKCLYFSEIILKNDSKISKGHGAQLRGDHADQIRDNVDIKINKIITDYPMA